MNAICFCLYTNKIFWEKEKILAFFYIISLILLFSAMLLFFGHSVKDCSFIFCVKSGIYGGLCLSVLIGFFIVWLQSLEERKQDFVILSRIGVRKSILILSLQLETLLFQFFSCIGALLLVEVFILLMEEYEMMVVCMCAVRLQCELQVIMAVAICVYMRLR